MKTQWLLATIGVLTLAACTNLDSLKKMQVTSHDFSTSLAKEYQEFSQSEADQRDWSDSDFFAKKGRAAATGQSVLPEDPATWRIAPEHQAELAHARQQLLSALTEQNKQAYPHEAAHLQGVYDCWVEQQEENWQTQDINACKETFKLAIQQFPPQGVIHAELLPYTVNFAFASSDLDNKAKAIVQSAAQFINAHPGHDIWVKGYTDAAGTHPYNDRLSLKRAEMVRNALVHQGVNPERVHLEAFGKRKLLVSTPDGVKELRNRRAEIIMAK